VRRRRAAIWEPSLRELLLLRACLWEGERGLDAWREWRRGTGDVETIEAGSHRLLPLAYSNLGPLPAGDPDAERLKGAYRRSWAVNQLGLRIGRRAIDALHAAGLEVLALKGAALIGSAYRDAGARPVGDVDLAVRPRRVGEAVRALREAGFTPVEEDPVRLLAVRHSLAFRDPDGQEVDLHRGLQWRAGLDEDLWREAVEAEVAGARVLTLCPADQLLHVCVHGAPWNPVQPIRWAADAFKVLEAAGSELDWDRLVAMAAKGRLALPLHDAASYLATELEAPVPAAAIRELAAVPVSRGERRAHEALAQPPSSRRSLAMLSWFWERHRAQAHLDGRRATPRGLVRHLQGFWGLERPSRVPGYATRRLLRRRT
jgi:putative nucleotidyltransferase-like protein